MKKITRIIMVALFIFLIVWILAKKTGQPTGTGENLTGNLTLQAGTAYPVILVHGWMGKAVDFGPYAMKLQEDGIAEYKGMIGRQSNESMCPEKWPKNISVSAEYYYNDNFNHPIEDYAKELDHVLGLVENCTGSEDVILVAHSMGGLVSRKYMADYGHEHVKKLITLASPHYGFNDFTRSEIILMIFDLFTGRKLEIEQMAPNSTFLIVLDEADAGYRDKIVSIGTYNTQNKTLLFDLPVFQSEIVNFEQQYFANTDIAVKLDSTKLAGSKYYQVQGCSHTEILNFRNAYPKGPINNPNTCPEAYEIVKKEISETSK